MRRRPYGPRAWLLDEVSSPGDYATALAAMAVPGIDEIVPTEAAVVVHCTREHHEVVGALLDTVKPDRGAAAVAAPLVIEVVYDGPDLADLAAMAELTVDELVQLHVTGAFEVAFCGFSPGFGYLRGLPARLHVPRRPTPRTSVPAGAVGIAAGYSCVYPSPSPGGWHLIGHTALDLWDADRDPPSLFVPGRQVQFRAVTP